MPGGMSRRSSATKRPGDYDAAITVLRDLLEISERKGRRGEVAERIRALREVPAKKPSFLAREEGRTLIVREGSVRLVKTKNTCLGFEPRGFAPRY
jgi:hypothetical protein